MAAGHKTGGREKGTPNKISTTVRENVVSVFDQIGGKEKMAAWAADNQTEFYRIYARLLPTEATLNVNRATVGELSDSELIAIAAGSGEGTAEQADSAKVTSSLH